MWLRDYHIDALRLDAVHAIVDTTAYPFLEQLADEVAQLEAHTGRPLALIAESDLNDPRLVRVPEAGGFGLTAQWCDDFHHALHTALTGERDGYYVDYGSLAALACGFEHPYIYRGQQSQSRIRSHGRAAYELSGHRFVTYSQNHDQVGNRAKGERLGHLIGERRARIAAALVLASPYVPQLFQGEEWNTEVPFLYFADWREEPKLAEAVRQGRLAEFAAFGWTEADLADPISEETFKSCKLNWNEMTLPHGASMRRWYQRLIQLRRALPDLTDGRLSETEASFDEEREWLLVRRGRVLVAANLSQRCTSIELPKSQAWSIVLHSDDDCQLESNEDGTTSSNASLSSQQSSQLACIATIDGNRLRLPAECVAVLLPAHYHGSFVPS